MTENMKDMNLVILEGRCGKDADVKSGSDGAPFVACFSVATAHSRKDKDTGEWVEDTEWHNVRAFGKSANYAAETVRKGCSVRVIGRIHYGCYTARDGTKRYSVEIIADNIVCCRKKENQRQAQETDKQQPPVASAGLEDDLPF